MKKGNFKSFWLKNKKKNIKILVVSVLVLFVVFAVAAGIRISNLMDYINPDDGLNFSNADESYYEDDTNFEAMHDISDASSLDDLVYKWATNDGEKVSSKNVVNVMLFGVDTEDGLMGDGRTDAMLLVSLNKESKVITIVSFMRDSYTYMDINGQKRFFKVNAAYGWGGPATVVKIIEDNYKIAIDNYVCVDFATFPKIIDSLGGVTVDVQPYEAKCIKDFFEIQVPFGEGVVLDGQSALMFSRIRKCDVDGDISRTRRQRAVIMAIIESAGDASTIKVNSALDFIFPYIRTNYQKSEILSLGAEAKLKKWADYEIVQITSPAETNSASATIKTHFVWVIDYPLEAQAIQTALYGKTNIILDENRVSALKMLPKKPVTTTNNNKLDNETGESTTSDESDTNETTPIADTKTTTTIEATAEQATSQP